MRKKQFSKKLSLNKETVANLDKNSLNGIVAGADSDPGSTCNKCITEDAFCEPTKTACTGPYCPTNQYDCTQAATCEGWTCDFPYTCGTC